MKSPPSSSRRARRFAVGGALVGWSLVVAASSGCEGRPRSGSDALPKLAGGGALAVIDLSQGAPESTASGGLFPLPARQTHVGLVRALQRLASDNETRGVFVTLGEAKFGFAQASEIGRELAAVRNSGKQVTCHAHHVDNATSWLLRTGCSEIWLSAAGDVGTVGIAAQLTYLKGALDRVGVDADMLAMGRYKSGGEPLTREGPTEPSRQNLTDTLRDIRQEWLGALSRSAQLPTARGGQERSVDERAARALKLTAAVEDGPWLPPQAVEQGLVDRVGFEDEALEAAKDAAEVDAERVVFGPGEREGSGGSVADLVRLLSGADERAGGRPRIAVVPAVGNITMGADGPFGGGITAHATTRTLERLREDDAVRAVVLRIDSPGGSPLASDLIWREMMRLREKKPVIASVGGMAASGGYYLISGASKIVAEPASIVGSIGVFGGKIVVEKALGEVGVNVVTFPASPEPGAAARASHLSVLSPWDDATREKVRVQMRGIYDLFLARVAEGRKMAVKDVAATAQGAIFTARTGKARGLVDELGGLARALELARAEAGLDAETPVVVEGPAESVLEALLLGEQADANAIDAALARYEARQLARLASLPQLRELKPFAAALAPLLEGEAVVAALPYALELR